MQEQDDISKDGDHCECIYEEAMLQAALMYLSVTVAQYLGEYIHHDHGQSTSLQAGNFLPDGQHIVATVNLVGASAGDNYSGQQVIILKIDGNTFPNGDTWICVTCGVPLDHVNSHDLKYDYLRPFLTVSAFSLGAPSSSVLVIT